MFEQLTTTLPQHCVTRPPNHQSNQPKRQHKVLECSELLQLNQSAHIVTVRPLIVSSIGRQRNRLHHHVMGGWVVGVVGEADAGRRHVRE